MPKFICLNFLPNSSTYTRKDQCMVYEIYNNKDKYIRHNMTPLCSLTVLSYTNDYVANSGGERKIYGKEEWNTPHVFLSDTYYWVF